MQINKALLAIAMGLALARANSRDSQPEAVSDDDNAPEDKKEMSDEHNSG